MPELDFHERPVLRSPDLLMGFSGWPNAGEVSSGTVSFLKRSLKAKHLATISPDGFYDFTKDRPTARISAGRLRENRLPRNEFFYARSEAWDRDLLLFSGVEPNLRWNEFCGLVVETALEMGVRAIFTLGGTYDYVPHWMEPQVMAVYSDEAAEQLTAGLERHVRPADYDGPVSIHTMLMVKGREAGLPVVGLWGRAPVYLQTGNVKINLYLVEMLKRMSGFDLDTSELAGQIEEMDGHIKELVAGNPRLKKYVDDLAREYRGRESGSGADAVRTETDNSEGRGKVIPFEQFFHRDDD